MIKKWYALQKRYIKNIKKSHQNTKKVIINYKKNIGGKYKWIELIWIFKEKKQYGRNLSKL